MATAVQLLPRKCSCSNRLGAQQFDYEELLNQGLTIAAAMNKMGWMKMCCRAAVVGVPIFFIRDSNADAFTDETGLTIGKSNHDLTKAVTRDGPPVVPKRKPLDFPPLPGFETPMSPKKAVAPIPPPIPALDGVPLPAGLPFAPTQGKVVAIGHLPPPTPHAKQPAVPALPGMGPAGLPLRLPTAQLPVVPGRDINIAAKRR